MVNLGPLPEESARRPASGGSVPDNYVNDHYEGMNPPDHFVAVCMCPACGEEGLHWLRAPRPQEGTDEETKTNRYWRGNIKNPVALADFDVIRTCTKCEVSWGQGAPKPKADTVELPTDLTPAVVTDEDILDDRADTLADIQNARLQEYQDRGEDPGLQSGWSSLKDVVGQQSTGSVPAPIYENEKQRAIDQWQNAFMEGVAPERTAAEEYILGATKPPEGLTTGGYTDIPPGSEHLASVSSVMDAYRPKSITPQQPPDLDEDGNEVAVRPGGGELQTPADASPKIGKSAVDDYRARGGKMTITGPGGMVMAAKNPETGQWEVPRHKRIFKDSQRATGPELTSGHTPSIAGNQQRAIEGDPIDVEEVQLPGDDND